MNQPSNDLFDIIQKLTPQEKIFFKAYFVKKKDENHKPSFLILFDALNELETYDQQKLKTLLDKKGFNANFFKIQTYLTETILKGLVEYYSENDKEIRIVTRLQQAKILLNKNLYHIAKKYFDRAKCFAEENSMHEYFPLIDYLEFSFHKKKRSWINNYTRQVDLHIKAFQKEIELRKLGVEALMLTIDHYDKHIGGKNFQKKVKKVLHKLNTIAKEVALNNFSKSGYYNAKLQCLIILNDWKKIDKTSKEYFRYLKSLPNTNTSHAKTVLYGLNSILTSYMHAACYENIETLFCFSENYFHSLPKKICTPDISSLFFSYIMENMLAYYNETGQPEKTLTLWRANKKDIIDYSKKNVASLYEINVAYAEFLIGNYHQTIRIVNKIEFNPIRPAVFLEAKLLQLLAHFELGNYDILPPLTRITKQFYQKASMMKQPEKLLLDFFEKKILKIQSRNDEKSILIQLKDQYAKLPRTTTAGSINIILWLESKITGVPLVKLIAQKTVKK